MQESEIACVPLRALGGEAEARTGCSEPCLKMHGISLRGTLNGRSIRCSACLAEVLGAARVMALLAYPVYL